MKNLKCGIYKINWKSGGSSIASVGMKKCGGFWLAPTNWVKPSTDESVWHLVSSVELLTPQSSRVQIAEEVSETERGSKGFGGSDYL